MTDQQAQDLARGEHARRILEDPMVAAALAAVKATIREQMFDLPIEATKSREFIAMMDKARQQFEQYFEQALAGEKIATIELQAERQAMELAHKINQRVRYG